MTLASTSPMRIASVELVATDGWVVGSSMIDDALVYLRRELAPLEIARRQVEALDRLEGSDDAITFEAAAWRAPSISFAPFDHAFARGLDRGANVVRIRGRGAALPATALEVLTRYQRHTIRTNVASAPPAFAAVIARHRALHDLSKPLVCADYDHALDTWQWMLRLDPEAGVAAQLAALFHDIERLQTEADVRIEHRQADYRSFKNAHAKRGAALAAEIIGQAFSRRIVARVTGLIEGHEHPSEDPELRLLNDADALSFFSLNSSGFVDYFPPDHTARKVAYTLDRMSPSARARLHDIRLRDEVATLVHTLSSKVRA